MRNIPLFLISAFLSLLFLSQELSAFPKPPILNVSTDLDQLPGPYLRPNMLPNNGLQDSQPLLNDAIRWVSHYNSDNPSTPYTQIIAQPGIYYFFTTSNVGGRDVYVVVSPENVHDTLESVTIDLGGSSLYFNNALYEAFSVIGCQNVVLSNFSIDYGTLPFTELRVKEVVLDTNQIVAVPIKAFPREHRYVDVYQLGLTQPGATLYGFDFRHGRLNPLTGRWTILPLTEQSNILTLEQGDVGPIEPGDIFEVEARGGGPAIWVESCSGIQLNDLSIYSSGGVGIITNYSPSVLIENVKIIPRPLTNRLVSTNAGGIAVNSTAQDNVVRKCTISGTQDDCISGNSPAVGSVVSLDPTSLTVVLAQPNQEFIPDGNQVYFVNPLTGGIVVDPSSGQTIVCTVSSSSVTGNGQNKMMQVIMQSALPSEIAPQQMMYAMNTATRGQGLIIDSNDISSNTLARGIALSGQTGVTIINNTLSRIQEAGIICGTDYALKPKQSTYGPISNISILNNHLHRTNIGVGSIGITMLAAIQILTINLESAPASAEADENINILDNEIDDTPRTGIWVMNIGSGEILNNRIQRWGYNPSISRSTIPPQFPVTSSDFQQALIIQSSSVVTGTNPRLDH
jgi:Right handed beta helix region